MARPADRVTGAEDRPLHPAQVQVWTLGWGAAVLMALALVLAVEVVAGVRADLDLPWPTGALTAALAVPALVAVGVVPRIAYRRWRWSLAERTLELRRGVLIHVDTAIPYSRVQHIDITRSPIERALGLSQLVVRTAAATTDATIPGVAVAEAETLRDVILARTGDEGL